MQPEQELLNVFNAVKDALMSNDTEAIGQIFSDDYRGHNLRGDVDSRDEIIEAYRPGNVRLTVYDVQEIKAEVVGDIGLVTGIGTITGQYGEIKFEHRIRFIDIFIRRSSRWQYYLSQGTEIINP